MPPPSSISVSKAEARARFRAYRRSLDAAALARLSRALVDRLASLPEWETARVVHSFWPMVGRGEVDVRPLLRRFRESGKTIVLPVVDDAGGTSPEPRLSHVVFEDERSLHPNRWGTLEPARGTIIGPDAIDAVIVPALGLDRDGYRLGYGAGYYDVFLKNLPAVTIGPVYEACFVEVLPREPHDVPLDLVVTEKRVIRPPAATS